MDGRRYSFPTVAVVIGGDAVEETGNVTLLSRTELLRAV
jgi:hypothetical protein